MNELIKIAIFIVLIVATYFIAPILKEVLKDKKYEQLLVAIEYAVRAAEQLYTPDEWAMKKQYVLEYIRTLLDTTLKLNLTEQDLNILIEGIVNAVKHPSV